MKVAEMIVWMFGLLCGAVVLCSPAACVANRHIQVEKAIEAGADPLEAKCAIEGLNDQSQICLVLAARAGTGGGKQ